MLQVKDLRTGQLLPIKREKSISVAWAADNKTLFYTVEDPAKRSSFSSYTRSSGVVAPSTWR